MGFAKACKQITIAPSCFITYHPLFHDLGLFSMALYTLSTLLSASCFLLANSQSQVCPFNRDECICDGAEPSKPNYFASVQCISDKLPVLNGPGGVKYTAFHVNIRSSELSSLPAMYLASAFTSMEKLSLWQNGSSTTPKWDDQAFENVQIKQISIDNFDNLFPLPNALGRVGMRGLKVLEITTSSVTVSIGASSFADFRSLEKLSLGQIPIIELDPNAFQGLESTLNYLSLVDTDLGQFPTTALAILRHLITLDLGNNLISAIPKNAFANFPLLSYVDLSRNPLAKDIRAGSLDSLPRNIVTLRLSRVGLTTVPRRMLQTNKQLSSVVLESNPIDNIKKSDFAKLNGSLSKIVLDGNPVSKVDAGAFESVSRLDKVQISLAGTDLETIDLAMFSGLGADLTAVLNDNSRLTTLTVSVLDGVSA